MSPQKKGGRNDATPASKGLRVDNIFSSLEDQEQSSKGPMDTEMQVIPPIPDPFKDLELYLEHDSVRNKYPPPAGYTLNQSMRPLMLQSSQENDIEGENENIITELADIKAVFDEKAAKAMRPSQTLNETLASLN